ncbi:hypothetical protein DEI82_14600 [Curtobacterium sp. MCBD17_019]|nr:hypothetical protein DEI86_15040 [Curtobacterium sp. MCBD17_028]PZE72849.1 hypothetical protein DEI82_14600 [Curtobacterium sp. MCBD17_019]
MLLSDARQLGDAPADVERRGEWTRLAAEVDTFRARYRVDAAETQAIPAAFREQKIGSSPPGSRLRGRPRS